MLESFCWRFRQVKRWEDSRLVVVIWLPSAHKSSDTFEMSQ
jgi:hypothetical protein